MPRPSAPAAAVSEDAATDLATRAAARRAAAPSVFRDYLELTKPEISFLVAISALAGFLFGSPGQLDGVVLLATLVGVTLTSAGAAVLNHVVEHDLDAEMKRTANRPLPAGRLTLKQARTFGLLLGAAGIGILCPLTNPLTAVLAGATAALYLYVYTPLKRKTKYNTLVGTIPGALPALGGYVAATNDLGVGGWTIFGILLLWQMPHFLSLAWMYRKDYGRAHYAMLPVLEPDGRSTALQTLGCTALLLLVSLTPTLVDVAGWLYFAGALLLGLYFLRPALAFYRTRSNQDARRVLKASIVYIPALVACIGLDWIVRAFLIG